jgi:hypothetical protein
VTVCDGELGALGCWGTRVAGSGAAVVTVPFESVLADRARRSQCPVRAEPVQSMAGSIAARPPLPCSTLSVRSRARRTMRRRPPRLGHPARGRARSGGSCPLPLGGSRAQLVSSAQPYLMSSLTVLGSAWMTTGDARCQFEAIRTSALGAEAQQRAARKEERGLGMPRRARNRDQNVIARSGTYA